MCRGPRKFYVLFAVAEIIRLDGFFIFQQFCKSLGLHRFLQTRLPVLRFYPLRENRAAAEPTAWDKKHKFITIWHQVQEAGPSSARFRNDGPDFRALVANLDLEPESVWRFYTDRANSELLIRELKNAYDTAKCPANSFFANVAYVEISPWAYDLVMAFKALCLPKAFQS